MAKAAAKRTKQSPHAHDETHARTPFTSSEGAVCVLLLLTIAGVATEAVQLVGNVRLLMLGATALALLIGFSRPRLWLTIPAILIVAGGAVAGGVALSESGATTLWIAVSAAIAAALGLLAIGVSSVIRRVYQQMRESWRIIDAFMQIDPATGAFRPRAGRERLRTEVARAVRYRRPFTLLIGKVSDETIEPNPPSAGVAHKRYDQALRTAISALRTNDIVANEPDNCFMVIMPETTAEGGEFVAQRIQEAAQGLVEVRFGLVQCPDDGETEEGLLREAYQALALAQMANVPIVSRRALVAGGA